MPDGRYENTTQNQTENQNHHNVRLSAGVISRVIGMRAVEITPQLEMKPSVCFFCFLQWYALTNTHKETSPDCRLANETTQRLAMLRWFAALGERGVRQHHHHLQVHLQVAPCTLGLSP
jgi:hypothetical protein